MIRLFILFSILWSLCFSAHSQATSFTDLKFSQYQIADSQWDTYSCLNTSSCNIYYTDPGTMYTIPWWNGQWNWQSGQYVKFSLSGISGYPYTANVYNSNGSLAGTVGSGKIVNMGVDSGGYALFFFVGTDDNTGQLFSTNAGLTGNNGYSWTGTLNPTTSQADTFATSYGSTTPLAAGQTYTSGGSGGSSSTPTYPSYVTIGGGTAGTMTFTETSVLSNQQQSNVDTWTNKALANSNIIYIQQIGGTDNTVTMDQDGSKNLIRLQLNGTNNNITARQGVSGSGQNEMKLNFEGNNNVVNLNQSRNTQGTPTGTNGHYLDATIAGWGTNLTVQQTNTGGVGGHYNETTISGNGNSVLAKQTDNGNKIMFLKVDGALNNVEAIQKGTGQHKADITLTGDRNNATLLQEGSTANNATLNLTNAGGPASVIVQQNGGQNVSVTTSCATSGGCAPITVRQGY